MECVIYKGSRKPDPYLFIEREADFSRIPATLLDELGTLEKVMSLELAPGRTLAGADPAVVREQLRDTGYYLQLPPADPGMTP